MTSTEPQPAETPKKESRAGNIVLRFVSVAPLIPLLLWLMFGGPALAPWFALLICTCIAIIAHELFRMTIPTSRGLQLFGAAVTVGLALVYAYAGEYAFPYLSFVVTSAMIAALVVPDPVETAALRSGYLIGGPVYIGSLAHLLLLHALPHGGAWVLLSMFLAWLSDTGAYFAGVFFGKHKLYPKLSPKKTVEGALGGLAGSVVGALALSSTLLPELRTLDAVALALVAGALGQAGDLFESLLKRSTGVKDSGAILPGHGGLLDRVDALIFTSMGTWLYAAYVLPHR